MHRVVLFEKRFFYLILLVFAGFTLMLFMGLNELRQQKAQLVSEQYRLADRAMKHAVNDLLLQEKERTMAAAQAAVNVIVFKAGNAIDVARSLAGLKRVTRNYAKMPGYGELRLRLFDRWMNPIGGGGNSVTAEVRDLFETPRLIEAFRVERSTLTFCVLTPLYDEGRFAGAVEASIPFDALVGNMKHSGEEAIVLIAPRYYEALQKGRSEYFINGYNVVNAPVNTPKLLRLIAERGVEPLIDASIYMKVGGSMVNISDLHSRRLAKGPGYLLFDNYLLASKTLKSHDHTDIAYLLYFKQRSTVDLHGLERIDALIGETVTLLYALGALLAAAVALRFLFIRKTLQSTLFDFKIRLPNKARLMEIIEDAALNGKEGMLMILNVDNFSNLNIIYGFGAGDQILYTAARRLENVCGDNPVFHLESDEFAVYFSEGVSPLPVIKMIQNHFYEHPVTYGAFTINLTFSYGVAYMHENIFRHAVFALKQAKNRGSNRYHVYNPESDRFDRQLRESVVEKSRILYDAVKHDRIIPFFQGIRDNRTGEITKFETLARVVHDAKPLPLAQFDEAARATGMLPQITKIIIDKAFAYMKDKPYTFSINLSEDDLNQNYLSRYIQQQLHHHGIDPERVIFEILEGVSASGKKAHIEQLKGFKKMGIKLAIDDFGAEYSNFERVLDLDIDFLKIDAKYIKEIDVHQKSYEIVKAIVYFSKNTGIPCIAEYVSNAEIQVVVEKLGIEYSQGYHFSKPQSYIKS